jgi:hypothetical protein
MNRTQLEDANNAKWAPARSAVACKAWRWMPGMLLDGGLRIVGFCPEGFAYGHSATAGHRVWIDEQAMPDLADPATLGCLLALVREAWGACVHVAPDTGWHVRRAVLPNGSTINLGIIADTEAAALVAALQAAE